MKVGIAVLAACIVTACGRAETPALVMVPGGPNAVWLLNQKNNELIRCAANDVLLIACERLQIAP